MEHRKIHWRTSLQKRRRIRKRSNETKNDRTRKQRRQQMKIEIEVINMGEDSQGFLNMTMESNDKKTIQNMKSACKDFKDENHIKEEFGENAKAIVKEIKTI